MWSGRGWGRDVTLSGDDSAVETVEGEAPEAVAAASAVPDSRIPASWQSALSADQPAGPDLEYDADFLSLQTALRPATPGMVESEADADEGMDWRSLHALAKSLAERTRDLRLAVRIARIGTHADGYAGLAQGIAWLDHLVDGVWDQAHPQPDADDDMDITMRFNALSDFGDRSFLMAVDAAALATDGRASVSLRDIETAIGKRTPSEDEDVSEIAGRISAIFADPNLSHALSDIESTEAALVDIARRWNAQVASMAEARADEGLRFDPPPPPLFEGLERKLADAARHIRERLPVEVVEALDGETAEGGDGTETASNGLASRADADREIRRIIDWFNRNEPSSPVPILLERARLLISKSFLEIVEDLGEGGIAEARKAVGGGLDNDEYE